MLNPGESADDDDDSRVFVMFMLGGRGVRLEGKEASLYNECVKVLSSLHSGNEEAKLMSKTAAEKHLRSAILRALKPTDGAKNEPRARFERRLLSEIRVLRKTFRAPPREWQVTIPVRGITEGSLPFAFGAVTFVSGSSDEPQKLAARIQDYSPRRKGPKARQEQQVRENARAEIAAAFSAAPLASTNVLAADNEAAKSIGIGVIRRTVDTLDFFAPYFSQRPRTYRAFMPSDGERHRLPWAVLPVQGDD